jgi:hypothetical protein
MKPEYILHDLTFRNKIYNLHTNSPDFSFNLRKIPSPVIL